MLQPPRDLSTYDWLSLPGPSLWARNIDPSSRILYIGHHRVLRQQYIPSIGKWGKAESKELFNPRVPSKGICPTTSSGFHTFKHNHKLYTGTQFGNIHGRETWRRAELSYCCVKKVQQDVKQAHGAKPPLGIAAAQAVTEGLGEFSIGLLPVEVVVWTRVFNDFLEHYSMTYREWREFSDDKKAEYWHHHENPPWAFETLINQPAILNFAPSIPAVGYAVQ